MRFLDSVVTLQHKTLRLIELLLKPGRFWTRKFRMDEVYGWGLDIGSSSRKVLPLGCDKRRVTDVQCDMAHLPFKDDSFLLTIFRHSLEHTNRWRQALQEAMRVSQHVYVVLPKKRIWLRDPAHTAYFTLPNPEFTKLGEFEYGECWFRSKNVLSSVPEGASGT